MKLNTKFFTWLFLSFFVSIQCFAQLRNIRTEIGKKADQHLHYALVAPVIQTMDYLSTSRSEEDKVRYLSYLKSTAQKIALDIENDEPTVQVLIKTRSNSEIDQSLVANTSQIIGANYDYLLGEIKLKDLKELAEMEGVLFIEPSYLMSLELEESSNDINATATWDCGGNEITDCITGRNVIIGIIDGMPNRDHITFQDEAGNSRFQQYVNSNPHHHGSHVAGIAAGRGDQNAFNRGIAYGSNLIWYPLGNNNDLLTSVQDLINTANGNPLVINYSAGSVFGPRDGTTVLDQALGALIENNVIFVKSAGNNSSSTNRFNHFEGNVPNQNGEFIEFEFVINDEDDNTTSVEIWHNSQFDVQVSDNDWLSPDWSEIVPFGAVGSHVNYNFGSDDYIMITNSSSNFNPAHTDNQGNNSESRVIFIEYGSMDPSFSQGTYRIRLYPNENNGGVFDAYHNNLIDIGGFIDGDNYQTITMPGYCSEVITVSASQKNQFGGDWASYSSLGPSRVDGADVVSKPDIAAPGGSYEGNQARIWSASNASNDAWNGYAGTSMAAPHVTGSIALLMENFPQLTAAQVKEILQNSAAAIPNENWQGDNTLTPEDRKYWGAGKLDILAAYQSMVGFDYSPLPGNISERFKNAFNPELAGLPLEPVVSDWHELDYYKQKLSNGAIFHDGEDEEAFWMGEGIWQKWLEIDNVNSAVGLPATSEYPDANNNDYLTVFFEKGKIYWGGENAVVCNFNVEFSVNQQAGDVPFTVTFTDQSTATNSSVTGWLWDFGDGIFSNEQHPTHTYYSSGNFDVTLTIFDYLHGFSMTKNNYISTEFTQVESVIEQIEYFLNEDPGFGNATSLTITPSPVIESLIFSIDISLMNDGFNHLYVRARDDENVWSLTNVRSFYVEPAYALPQNIVKAEYFINTDPGLGNGTAIPVSSSPDITNIGFVAGIDDLPMGFHHLYIRAQDANGVWSLTNAKSFYVEPAYAIPQQIVDAEYFINDDPGTGNGIAIPLVASHDVTNLAFMVDITDLPLGFHHLYLRAKEANGQWSLTNVKSFYKEIIYNEPQNIVKAEYFFNTDPGMGNGIPVELIPAPDISGLVFIADALPLPLLENVLYVRAMDQNGKWSLTNVHTFEVDCADVVVDFEAPGCASMSTEFEDYSVNVHPLSEYRWDFGDGTPELITGVGNVEHTYAGIGDYDVRLIIVSREECMDTLVKTIVINEPPTVYAGEDQTICYGDEVTLNATYTYGTLSWSHGLVNGQPFTPAQTTTYTATSTSIYGCGPVSDQVTVTVIQDPVSSPGVDATICDTETFETTAAYATDYSAVMWHTSNGFGDFLNQDELLATYQPHPGDPPVVELCMEVWPLSPCVLSSVACIELTIAPSPAIQIISPSEGSIVCLDSAIELVTEASNCSSYLWTTSGNGNFSNMAQGNALYTPGTDDLAAGMVTLCVEGLPQSACSESATACITFTVQPQPQINLAPEMVLDCSNYDFQTEEWLPVQIAAELQYASAVQWQSSGDGIFSDPLSPTTLYTISLDDFINGSVELTLTATGEDLCMVEVSESITLQIPGQMIRIAASGARGISSYIDQSMLAVPDVTAPLTGSLMFMQNVQGEVYNPGTGVNQIGNWDATGYLANFGTVPACLPVYGAHLTDRTFNVTGPVSYIPVLTDYPIAIEDLFEGQLEKIQMIFDWSTFTSWMPGVPDLQELKPGYAYSLTTVDENADFTIEFPPFSWMESPTDVAINGVILNQENGNPVAGVEIESTGQPSVYTNAAGEYAALVPLGWSGTITPVKEHWEFSPASKSYTNVVVNIYDQHFTGLSTECDPAWEFTITMQTHTIAIPLSANPSIFGEPLNEGDYIGVFYMDDFGEEACGGFVQWPGTSAIQLTAYGNDPLTTEKDGFDQGEPILWKLYSCNGMFACDAVVTYHQAFPQSSGTFSVYGFSSLLSLACDYSQEIVLNENWNDISLFVQPDNMSAETILQAIVNDLMIMSNLSSMYWPAHAINTIGDWDLTSGYVVKMQNPNTLPVPGSSLSVNQISLSASDGSWHYLPVISPCGGNVSDIFSSIQDDVVIIKEIIGTKVWWPQYGITTLDALAPSRAYAIKIADDVVVEFPDCTGKNAITPSLVSNKLRSHWGEIALSPSNHLIYIPEEIAIQCAEGDELGVFTSDGIICGVYHFSGSDSGGVLVVKGNDGTSAEIDGMLQGEPFSFKIYHSKSGETREIQVAFDEKMPDQQLFAVNGLSGLKHIDVTGTGGNAGGGIELSVYPNPSGDIFHVQLINVQDKVSWQLMNLHGAAIQTGEAQGKFEIDLSGWPKGIYYLKLTKGGLQTVRKLVLQ